ncbi:MAG: hypothetical protein ABJA11_08350 [Pseudolysinimonas sp.]
MYGPLFGHGLGGIFDIFAAIIWAAGSLIFIAIIAVVIVLLVRFLWFGTKASRRYLELNGSPTPRVRPAAPAAAAAAPAAAAPTAPAAAPASSVAPAAPAAPAAAAAKPVTKPRTPPKPKA